jgi:sugar lactone lactonase YvrE
MRFWHEQYARNDLADRALTEASAREDNRRRLAKAAWARGAGQPRRSTPMKPRFTGPLAAGGFFALCALAATIALLNSGVSAAPGDVTGDLVLGQSGSFLSNGCGTSATVMCTPSGVAVDSNGNVWVAELTNHRVVEFDNPLGSCGTCDLTADRVIGQAGSFATKVCNLGGISASSLCYPVDVDVDASDNVYVVDFQNNRVLEYLNPIGTDLIADRVWGQLGSFTTGTYTTSPTANTLTNPISVAVDAAGNVYIADRGMYRVLQYDPPTTDWTADRVFGQFGSFTTGIWNNGGVSASILSGMNGIGVDVYGNLYVADTGNARALRYDTPISSGTTADLVFGQYGSFTSFTPNLGGVNADTLESPTDIDADFAGNVYITDTGTERSLIYDDPVNLGTTADVVFAQAGSFTSFGNNTGGLSASSQADPWAIAFDGACNLYLVEYGNNRVTEYDAPPHACVDAPTATPTSTPCPLGVCTPTPTSTERRLPRQPTVPRRSARQRRHRRAIRTDRSCATRRQRQRATRAGRSAVPQTRHRPRPRHACLRPAHRRIHQRTRRQRPTRPRTRLRPQTRLPAHRRILRRRFRP